MAFGEIFLAGYNGQSRDGSISGSQSQRVIWFILLVRGARNVISVPIKSCIIG